MRYIVNYYIMKVNKILLALAFIFVGGTAWAQGSLEDYQRAYSMRQKYGMDKVLNLNVMPQWDALFNSYFKQ